MSTFCCLCGGTFRNTDGLVYLSYPPKYLFRCDCCGATKVLSEAEAYGNSGSGSDSRPSLLDTPICAKELQAIL